MFWCHGGGFATGSGSSPGTDGTNLARRGDVVVVSINHRLNVLGFTNLVEAFGRDYAQSGDVGMLDIVQALEWVRTNIERFGGDPNTVMIFGQSGGGRKVSTLLTMPSAKGLFHRAVIESGATIKLVERDAAAKVADRLLAKLSLNNTQLRELQNLPVQKIMSAYFAVVKDMAGADQMTAGFSPTMDGKAVSQHPYFPTASAVSADVPVMIGNTRTELTLSSDEAAFSLDENGMRKRVTDLLGEHTSRAIDVYRRANSGATPVGHLLPDRQRLSLRRADDEDRRASGRSRKRSRLPLLLPVGDAGRRRPAQVAAHDGNPVRLRQRQDFFTTDRRRSGGDGARGQDQRCRGSPSPGPAIRTRRSCRIGRRSIRPTVRRWSSTTSARWRTTRFANSAMTMFEAMKL